MTPMQLIFVVVAAVTLFSAVMVVSVRRIMHSALFLVLALMGVAALFALLESTFFAIIQVLVYIGSIAILIIFAVMLTRHVMTVEDEQFHRGWWQAAILMVISLVGFLNLILRWQPFEQAVHTPPAGGEDILAFGRALTDANGFVIPFEVASILLVAVVVGSIYVAMDRKGGRG